MAEPSGPIGVGVANVLGEVAALYAAKVVARQAAKRVNASGGKRNRWDAQDRARDSAALFLAQQRAMEEAKRRIEQQIQDQRNEEAQSRLRNQRNVNLLGYPARSNAPDEDGFRWLSRPVNPLGVGAEGYGGHPDNLPATVDGPSVPVRAGSRNPDGPIPKNSPTLTAPAGLPFENAAPPPKEKPLPNQHGRDFAEDVKLQRQAEAQKAASFDAALESPGAYQILQRTKDIRDPAILQYISLLREYNDAQRTGKLTVDPEAPGADGDFGTSALPSTGNPWTIPGQGSRAFPFVLVKDQGSGSYKLVGIASYFDALNQEALVNREKAGELITTLAALGAYDGGADRFAEDRVQVVKDPKTGKAKILGRWEKDDADKLNAYLSQLSALQMASANRGEFEGIEQLMAREALARQGETQAKATGGNTGGSGGYGRGGGYGGGGSTGAVRYTDAEQLKSFVDSIARQRMGRVLTTDEATAFVNHYHELERQMAAAYYAGQSNVQLDAEAQAVAWIESRFRQESGANQYAQLFAAFARTVGGDMFGGVGS